MRDRLGLLSILATALLAAPSPGVAKPLTHTYRPPFGPQLETHSDPPMTNPPTPECAHGPSPVRPLHPDGATGRLDSSVGISTADCDHTVIEHATGWPLAVSPELVGRPALITLLVQRDDARLVASGYPDASEASIELSVDGTTFELEKITCTSGSCDRKQTAPNPGTNLILLKTVSPSLPDSLLVFVTSRASLSGGSGGVGAEFAGRVVVIAVHPISPVVASTVDASAA